MNEDMYVMYETERYGWMSMKISQVKKIELKKKRLEKLKKIEKNKKENGR